MRQLSNLNKLVYSRADQRLYFVESDGVNYFSIECRDAFFPGYNTDGLPRESLPNGDYMCNAEPYPAENNAAYGTCYISDNDSRGRVIHGGGSGLADSMADEQGWYPTLGCLRVQNGPGRVLSEAIIEAGNAVPLTVREEHYGAA